MLAIRPKLGPVIRVSVLAVFALALVALCIVLPKYSVSRGPRYSSAEQIISNTKTALGEFEMRNGRYPTNKEGLQALVANPGGLNNWSQGLEKVPTDPWGRPFVYRCPGNNGADYDLTYIDPKTGQESPE